MLQLLTLAYSVERELHRSISKVARLTAKGVRNIDLQKERQLIGLVRDVVYQLGRGMWVWLYMVPETISKKLRPMTY